MNFVGRQRALGNHEADAAIVEGSAAVVRRMQRHAAGDARDVGAAHFERERYRLLQAPAARRFGQDRARVVACFDETRFAVPLQLQGVVSP